MTRRRLNRILWLVIAGVGAFAAFMTWARYAEGQEKLYDLLVEAAPLAVGVGAAVLANAFQKRASFIGFLRDEWYNIVETKTALIVFCRRPEKTDDDAQEAWARISVAIDRMRILYRNVGETRRLIGFYPYEPLHEMRRALEFAMGVDDPLKQRPRLGAGSSDWGEVEQVVWRGFQALREVFLEELDLTEPDHPILRRGAERRKQAGASRSAQRRARRKPG